MRKPLIGLTMDHDDEGRWRVHGDYALAIERAGGIPVGLAATDSIGALLDRVDGILFTGGNDLDPSLYGETWHPQAEQLNAKRQAFELALVAEVDRRRRPALGVCLGSQLMNVHRGGSLHQFLPDVPRPSPIEHRKLDRPRPVHAIAIEPGSLLARTLGAMQIEANTYHKQAASRVGRNLRIVARAPDGIIEAMEDPDAPLFMAVQWHPERLLDRPEHLAVFELLVEKARSTPRDLGWCG